MIKLCDLLPQNMPESAETVKIGAAKTAYQNEALFWVQNGGRAFISLLDGAMVIKNCGGDLAELKEFVGFISPAGVFSDLETLSGIFGQGVQALSVFSKKAEGEPAGSAALSSREIFDMLQKGGLDVPQYEFFAPDFCRRLNRGQLKYFAAAGECAAVSIQYENACEITGVVSFKKGGGTKALCGVLAQNAGKTAFAVCKSELAPFYLKNGFEFSYNAAYWRKQQ